MFSLWFFEGSSNLSFYPNLILPLLFIIRIFRTLLHHNSFQLLLTQACRAEDHGSRIEAWRNGGNWGNEREIERRRPKARQEKKSSTISSNYKESVRIPKGDERVQKRPWKFYDRHFLYKNMTCTKTSLWGDLKHSIFSKPGSIGSLLLPMKYC